MMSRICLQRQRKHFALFPVENKSSKSSTFDEFSNGNSHTPSKIETHIFQSELLILEKSNHLILILYSKISKNDSIFASLIPIIII